MFLEIILALFLGLIAGTFTGLTPGIHINLIAIILVSSLTKLQQFSLISLSVFIVSMAIAHTFIDFIPSIFLGAPEEDTFLSILPGHRMLKNGQAYNATVLTLYGSLIALPIIIAFVPIFIYIIPIIFSITKTIFPYILIFLSIYLILRERSFLTALIVFLLSGFLGLTALNLPIEQPLLPLLTGLFGSSALIIAIKQKTEIPQQKITSLKKIKITKSEILKATTGSIISAPLASFLPGIGAGHAAVIGSEFIEQTEKGFLVLLGSINTIVVGLSFITIFSLGKTRTGVALVIKEILKTISIQNLFIIIAIMIISGIFSFFIALKISKIFSKNITRINYQKLSIVIILILSLTIIIFSNFLGFLVFLTATSLGIFAITSNVRRINLMGVLLIPTIVFYLLN